MPIKTLNNLRIEVLTRKQARQANDGKRYRVINPNGDHLYAARRLDEANAFCVGHDRWAEDAGDWTVTFSSNKQGYDWYRRFMNEGDAMRAADKFCTNGEQSKDITRVTTAHYVVDPRLCHDRVWLLACTDGVVTRRGPAKVIES